MVDKQLHPDEAANSRLTERLSSVLEQLYGTDSPFERLVELIDRWREVLVVNKPPLPPTNLNKFDEKDVILIAYPNHITSLGEEAPIQTLGNWCEEHLKEHISTVHLLPFHPSTAYDGYAITDFMAVDPKMGTWEELEMIRKGGFKLMIDLVLNHCSSSHPWFHQLLHGEDPGKRYFITRFSRTKDQSWLSKVKRARNLPLLYSHPTPHGEVEVWCSYHPDLVDLDWREPQVCCEFVEILLDSVARGASMFRLDAFGYVWKEPHSSCSNLPQLKLLHEVLRCCLDLAGAEHVPILPSITNVTQFENFQHLCSSPKQGLRGADLVYHLPLAALLLHTLYSGDTSVICWWLKSLTVPEIGKALLNLAASHDGIGLSWCEQLLSPKQLEFLCLSASKRGGNIAYRKATERSKKGKPWEINITLWSACVPDSGAGDEIGARKPSETNQEHVDRFMTTQAIVLTLQGVPGLYFGLFMCAENDTKTVEELRATLPPEEQERLCCERMINRQRFSREKWEESMAIGSPVADVLHRFQVLLRVRRAHVAFHPDSHQQIIDLNETSVLAVLRTPIAQELICGASIVLCLVNFSGNSVSVSALKSANLLNLFGGKSSHFEDLLFRVNEPPIDPMNGINLKAYEVLWLVACDFPGENISFPDCPVSQTNSVDLLAPLRSPLDRLYGDGCFSQLCHFVKERDSSAAQSFDEAFFNRTSDNPGSRMIKLRPVGLPSRIVLAVALWKKQNQEEGDHGASDGTVFGSSSLCLLNCSAKSAHIPLAVALAMLGHIAESGSGWVRDAVPEAWPITNIRHGVKLAPFQVACFVPLDAHEAPSSLANDDCWANLLTDVPVEVAKFSQVARGVLPGDIVWCPPAQAPSAVLGLTINSKRLPHFRCYPLDSKKGKAALERNPHAKVVHLIRHINALKAPENPGSKNCHCYANSREPEKEAALAQARLKWAQSAKIDGDPVLNHCPFLLPAAVDPPVAPKAAAAHSTGSAVHLGAEVVLSSPTIRTLSTLHLLFKSPQSGSLPPVVALEALRAHIGPHMHSQRSEIGTLKILFPGVEFPVDGIDADECWQSVMSPRCMYHGLKSDRQKLCARYEGRASLDARAAAALQAVFALPEKSIGIVSHFTLLWAMFCRGDDGRLCGPRAISDDQAPLLDLSAVHEETGTLPDLPGGTPDFPPSGMPKGSGQAISFVIAPENFVGNQGNESLVGKSFGESGSSDGKENAPFFKHIVRNVSSTPDGKLALISCHDKRIVVMEIATSLPLCQLKGHTAEVYKAISTPDGLKVVSSSADGTVRVWDLLLGRQLHCFHGHHGDVRGLAVSAMHVVSGGDDETVRVWDIATGGEQLHHVWNGHTGKVRTVCICGNRMSKVASGSDDGSVRVFDVLSGQEEHVLLGHEKKIRIISSTANPRFVVSGSDDATLAIWDVVEGRMIRRLVGHKPEKGAHEAWVRSVVVTPDCKRVISGSYDKTLRIFDFSSGECLHVIEGQPGWIRDIALTPDGSRVVSASYDATMRVYNVDSGDLCHILEGHDDILMGACCPSSSLVVSASTDYTVKTWDLSSGQEIGCLGDTQMVLNVCFSPNGEWLAAGCGDQMVRVWRLQPSDDGSRINTHLELAGHTGWVRAVAFTPDSRLLLSASGDKSVRMWSLQEKGGHLYGILKHPALIISLCTHPNGKHAVTGSSDLLIRVWDLWGGVQTHVLQGHVGWIRSVACTPNGQFLVTTSGDQTVRVWPLDNLTTDESESTSPAFSTGPIQQMGFTEDERINQTPEERCLGHQHIIPGVFAASDSKRAISASYDRTARLWNLENGAELLRLESHSSWVRTVCLTNDDNIAVTGSYDCSAAVWSLVGQKPEVIFSLQHPAAVLSVAATNNKTQREGLIASGCEDGRVRLWSTSNGEQLWDCGQKHGPLEFLNDTPKSPITSSSPKNSNKLLPHLQNLGLFLRDRASHYPDQVFLRLYSEEKGEIHKIVTYCQFAELALATLSKLWQTTSLEKAISPSLEQPFFLGLLTENSLDLLQLLAACWLSSGCFVPVVISPKCSLRDMAHILQAAGCGAFVSSTHFRSFARQALEEGNGHHPIPLWSLSELAQVEIKTPEGSKQSPPANDSAIALVLHTSGTSSAPKLVPLSHENITHNLLACTAFIGDNWNKKTSTLLWLSLSHGYALLSEFLPTLWAGGTCNLYLSTNPLQSPNVMSLVHGLQVTSATALCAVPWLLEELCKTIQHEKLKGPSQTLAILSQLKFLMTGGASLRRSTGLYLVENSINVVTVLGVTELAGSLMFSPFESNGCQLSDLVDAKHYWEALRIVPGLGASFQEGVAELVISPGSKSLTSGYLSGGTKVTPVRIGDLFTSLGAGFWRHCGRIDSIFKNATGLKTNPMLLEQEIERCTAVSAALVVGSGRPFNILLVETTQKDSNGEVQEAIGQAVHQANSFVEPHSQIQSAHIIVLPLGVRLPRTGKGTVDREHAVTSLSAIIERVYSPSSLPLFSPPPSAEQLRPLLLEAAESVGVENPARDWEIPLSSLGVSSVGVQQLHHSLCSRTFSLQVQIPHVVELIDHRLSLADVLSFILNGESNNNRHSIEKPLHDGSLSMFTHTEALEYVSKDLGLKNVAEILSKKSPLHSETPSLLGQLCITFLQHVPFQSITAILGFEENGSRALPSFRQIKAEVLGRRGGQCYVLNVFMCELLCALGFCAEYAWASIHGVEDCHITILVRDLCKTGDVWNIDVGCGYVMPHPVCLSFDGPESPIYEYGGMRLKFIQCPKGTGRLWRLHADTSTFNQQELTLQRDDGFRHLFWTMNVNPVQRDQTKGLPALGLAQERAYLGYWKLRASIVAKPSSSMVYVKIDPYGVKGSLSKGRDLSEEGLQSRVCCYVIMEREGVLNGREVPLVEAMKVLREYFGEVCEFSQINATLWRIVGEEGD